VIFEIGSENYDYAFVSGMNTDYLWLLSRSPEVDEKLLDLFRSRAKSLGFKIEDLIMVDQSE
jgi:apolipoprotein D and lipocalin family protein